jgi:hypothetical protein
MESFEKALASIADGDLHDFGIGTGVTNAFGRCPIGFDRSHATLERIDCYDYLANVLHLYLIYFPVHFSTTPIGLR